MSGTKRMLRQGTPRWPRQVVNLSPTLMAPLRAGMLLQFRCEGWRRFLEYLHGAGLAPYWNRYLEP